MENGVIYESHITEFDSSTTKVDLSRVKNIDFKIDKIRFWDLDGSNAMGPSAGSCCGDGISIEAIYAWGDLTSNKKVYYSTYHHSHVWEVCEEFVKLTDPKFGLYEIVGIKP